MRWLVFFALLLTGCASYIQDRNVNRMDDYALRYPAKFAELANKLNPCTIGKAKSDTSVSFLKPETTWVPTVNSGELVPIGDGKPSLTGAGALTFAGSSTTFLRAGTMRITNTKLLTIHDTVTDQRALSACQTASKVKADSLMVQNTNLATSNKNKSVWRWIALGCIGLITVSVVWKVYKFINPVAKVV